MKLFLKYLKIHRKGIGSFFLFSVIFFVIFWLYELPAEAVLYACAVCGFLGLVILVLDYLRFVKKYRKLLLVKQEVGITLEKLPEATNEMELLYQELLQGLYQQKQQSVDEHNSRYKELMEYYTIWAHQIKTPIAAMDLILQKEDTALTRELREELRRIGQYVEMVLVVLRLDSESTDYVIQEYELDDLIKQAVRKYASQFIYKKIQLVYEPVQLRVVTDEKWLLFVLEQVLSNALKYTRTGSIEITVKDQGILCIRDTGIGIAAEDLPRIFEKGYTGYNGRSDKKASGIGLYLCRRILGKLGHTVTAESEVGVGTTIQIDLRQQKLEVE